MESRMRAVRGATTVEADDPAMMRVAVKNLVDAMIELNGLDRDDFVDLIATVTPDLTSMYAGTAVREECGFGDVPLLGAVEASVAGGPARCIRLMLHTYTARSRSEIVHVYQGRAKRLRPDLDE